MIATPVTRQGGFTLLELMVVLVIMGVLMSFVGLNVGGDGRAEQLEREARRLAALLQLASEEALIRSEELAVRFTVSRYEFMLLQNGSWQAIGPESDRPFRSHELPDGIELDLEVDGELPASLDSEEDTAPQVFLLSSGEITPFTLTLLIPDTEQQYQIRATLLGHLELELELEPE